MEHCAENGLKIRMAEEGDVPVILNFILELAEYEGARDRVQSTESGLKNILFKERGAEALIAEVDGEPVGFAIWAYNAAVYWRKLGLAARSTDPPINPKPSTHTGVFATSPGWHTVGEVLVNGKQVTKAGHMVTEEHVVELTAKEQYVNRAALKLASVAQALKLDFRDKTVLDVGSSTGGFTEYALRHGARAQRAAELGRHVEEEADVVGAEVVAQAQQRGRIGRPEPHVRLVDAGEHFSHKARAGGRGD
mgnify:CR=1 FL=1